MTGSLHAGMARWLISTGIVAGTYRAAQGTAIGRQGRVEIDGEDGDVWVGGTTTLVVEGTTHLPDPAPG